MTRMRMWIYGAGLLGLAIALVLAATPTTTVTAAGPANCQGLPTGGQLEQMLIDAPTAGTYGESGGLFSGARMWASVVNRNGEVCDTVTNTVDPSQVWPGSQSIAKSKAYTANAFSLDGLALSTALLYTFTQPRHSLWSLGQANPFNPDSLAALGSGGGKKKKKAKEEIAGGMIFFGGGVPLYDLGGSIIGGLGVSGDTSCTDHEIAKRVRDLAGLNPPGGMLVDDITYSGADGASVFTHPLCLNTWRNNVSLGDEAVAVGY